MLITKKITRQLLLLLFFSVNFLCFTSPSYSASKNSSSLLETIRQGKWPSSFVSIAENLPSGEFKHRAGGVLIYPGVVLSSTYYMDILHEYRDGYTVNKRNLYIVFPSLNNGKPPIRIKVYQIISHDDKEDPPYYGDVSERELSLFFFQNNEETIKILPVPLMDEEDRILFHKENPMDSLWAVGAVDYDEKEITKIKKSLKNPKTISTLPKSFKDNINNFLCPKSTLSGIAPVMAMLSPEESSFLSLLVNIHPGKKGQKYVFNLKKRESFGNRTMYFAAQTSELIGSSQGAYVAPHYVEGLPRLKYFCHDHFGYPILWENEKSQLKIMSLVSSNSNMGVLALELNFFPRLSGIETLRFIPWIKKQIGTYHRDYAQSTYKEKKSALDKFFPDYLEKPMRESWEGKRERPEFLVGTTYSFKDKKNSFLTHSGSCTGAFIAEGVVLTAGHCLEELYHFYAVQKEYKISDKEFYDKYLQSYVVFRKGSKNLKFKTYRVELYGYRDENIPLKDLGLLFFHQGDDFPDDIKPAPLAHKKDWEQFLTSPQGSAMLGATHHGLEDLFISSYRALFSRAVFLHHQSTGMAWYEGNLRGIDPQRFQSVVIPRYEKITGIKFNKKEIIKRLAPDSYFVKHGMALARCLEETDEICTTIHHREGYVAQSRYMCGGVSGAPVAIRNSPEAPWKIVGVMNTSTMMGNPDIAGCKSAGNALNITLPDYRQWIQDHLEEHAAQLWWGPSWLYGLKFW